jgi:putative copper resistance protein D
LIALGIAIAMALVPAAALAHGGAYLPPEFPAVLLHWHIDLLVMAGITLAAIGYIWAEWRVARAHPASRPPTHRRWLWFAGLAAIGLALLSPIEVYDDVLLSDHMVQHMLLEFIAAPLLLLAAPITLALRALSARPRRALLVVLHSRIVRALAFPLVAWVIFAAVNWGWHFSSLYDLALTNDAVHYIEHACFIAAALLFWWPAIGPDPAPWRMPHPVRILYLFLAMPQNSFLGVAILSSGTVLYEHYITTVRSWGPSPLDDQRLAGSLMWVAGDMVFLAAMIGIVAAWMRYEDRRTKRIDARLDAEEAERASQDLPESAPSAESREAAPSRPRPG